MPSIGRRAFLAGVGTVVATSPAAAHWEESGGAESPTTWTRSYTPAEDTVLVRAVVPTDGGLLLAGLAGDPYRGWVAGVDRGGRVQWHRLLGVAQTAFFAAVRTPEGVLLAGLTNETLRPPRPNTPDPYVVHVLTDGDVAWARTYQPGVPEGGARVVVPANGGHVVAGYAREGESARPWAVATDEEGTARWEWTAPWSGTATSAVSPGDGVVLAGVEQPGTPRDGNGGEENAWIARLDGGGLAWRRRFEGDAGDRIEALAPAADGGVVALGRRGFDDSDRGVGWLAAIDTGGTVRWEHTYPQERWNWHHALAPLDDGYGLVGTRETAEGDRGAWLLKVDDAGLVTREHQFDAGTRGYAVHPLADGGILVGGDTTIDDGRHAGWLAKLGGDPAPTVSDGATLRGAPDWAVPFVAGAGLGGTLAAAAGYLRG